MKKERIAVFSNSALKTTKIIFKLLWKEKIVKCTGLEIETDSKYINIYKCNNFTRPRLCDFAWVDKSIEKKLIDQIVIRCVREEGNIKYY